MTDIIAGAVIMGNAVASLFFWRFWNRTRDRLFAMFGAAFMLLAVHRGLVAAFDVMRDEQSWLYVIRFAAFVLIIVAVLLKNSESRRGQVIEGGKLTPCGPNAARSLRAIAGPFEGENACRTEAQRNNVKDPEQLFDCVWLDKDPEY